jgi:hypothetical protein
MRGARYPPVNGFRLFRLAARSPVLALLAEVPRRTDNMGEHGMASVPIGFVVALCFLASVRFGFGQSDPEAEVPARMAEKLMGGSTREWVFKNNLTFMDSPETCTQGETDYFSADHCLSEIEGRSALSA